MHRNATFFKGSSFEEQLEQAVEQHAKLVSAREPKVYWKEPSQHDIMYSKDPVTGQRTFYPSGVPAEPGLGEPEPEDIADRVRRQIQGQAMLQLARELGVETYEEANDFQVEEGQDLCPYSGHEYDEQDEAAHNEEYARLVKEKEDREAAELKAAKRREYEEMKKAYEADNAPPPSQPDNSESN